MYPHNYATEYNSTHHAFATTTITGYLTILREHETGQDGLLLLI